MHVMPSGAHSTNCTTLGFEFSSFVLALAKHAVPVADRTGHVLWL